MLKKIENAIDKIEGAFSVIIFLAMVFVVCWSVLCRYVLKISFLQGEELARYMMIYVVYIGTSIGVKNRSHIGVDVFVDLITEKGRRFVKIVTEILCAGLFAVLFILSIQMMSHLIETMQMTTTTHIPTYYVFLCVPIGILLGFFHYVVEIVDRIVRVRGEDGGEEAKA